MTEKLVQASAPAEATTAVLRDWSIDTELGLLRDGTGTDKRLEPRLSRLMSVLLENAGNLVSRRTLIETMWPNVVVTEQSLTRAVADLRKFLRSNYDQPPIIETASKQGYRILLSGTIPEVENERSMFLNFVRYGAYIVGALILLVLVLRGVSY